MDSIRLEAGLPWDRIKHIRSIEKLSVGGNVGNLVL